MTQKIRVIRLAEHEAKEAIHALVYERAFGNMNASDLLDKFLAIWPELEEWADGIDVDGEE